MTTVLNFIPNYIVWPSGYGVGLGVKSQDSLSCVGSDTKNQKPTICFLVKNVLPSMVSTVQGKGSMVVNVCYHNFNLLLSINEFA